MGGNSHLDFLYKEVNVILTPQQESIIKAVTELETVGTNAVAGSSKTTTGRLSEEALLSVHLNVSILNVAFNKLNALDFEKKMPKGSVNKTFNGVGHSAIMKMLGKRVTLLPKYGGREKTYELMNKMSMDRDDFPDLPKAIGIAKNSGLVPIGGLTAPPGLIPDSEDTWDYIFDNFDIDTGRLNVLDAAKICREVLCQSIIQALRDGVIDFDDQLYISTLWGAPFQIFDFIFVDEAQDLNPLQHKMVWKLSHFGESQVMVTGDRHQAIYAFRGASSKSFDELISMFECKLLPLTVSFRCPKKVVIEAQKTVPEIEYWNESSEGEVNYLPRWNSSTFRSGDVILCRNTKPLVPIFYYLIKEGVGAKIKGSEIGKGLITILKKISPINMPSSEALPLIELWAEAQYRKYAHKDLAKAEARREQGDVLHMIVSRHKDLEGAALQLKLMFSDVDGQVTLSTIHKAKGLEWKNVFFLDRDLIPSKYARQDWELEQESNLVYVGVTRAMSSLNYIQTTGLGK